MTAVPKTLGEKVAEVKKAVATASGFVVAVAASVALLDTSSVENLVLSGVAVVTTVTTYYAKNKRAR